MRLCGGTFQCARVDAIASLGNGPIVSLGHGNDSPLPRLPPRWQAVLKLVHTCTAISPCSSRVTCAGLARPWPGCTHMAPLMGLAEWQDAATLRGLRTGPASAAQGTLMCMGLLHTNARSRRTTQDRLALVGKRQRLQTGIDYKEHRNSRPAMAGRTGWNCQPRVPDDDNAPVHCVRNPGKLHLCAERCNRGPNVLRPPHPPHEAGLSAGGIYSAFLSPSRWRFGQPRAKSTSKYE